MLNIVGGVNMGDNPVDRSANLDTSLQIYHVTTRKHRRTSGHSPVMLRNRQVAQPEQSPLLSGLKSVAQFEPL